MKKAVTVEVVEVANEGLISLLGKTITCFCMNYIYTGKLEGVNDTCILWLTPRLCMKQEPSHRKIGRMRKHFLTNFTFRLGLSNLSVS